MNAHLQPSGSAYFLDNAKPLVETHTLAVIVDTAHRTGAKAIVWGQDFDAFERLLGEMQAAYSREDLGALRMMSTPEMASYFDDELEANRRKGVVNRVSNVKLLSGDLAEAWREGGDEYATVAMRFALNDVMEDRATGKVLPGSPGPSEATEAWTFRRDAGAGQRGWKLSAIQQSAGRAESRVA